MANVIKICLHCSTECSGALCNYCKTKEKRAEMDKANRENLGKEYDCSGCGDMQRIEDVRKLKASGKEYAVPVED